MLEGSVPPAKQAKVCLDYCQRRNYRLAALVPASRPQDALTMVADARVSVVVLAYRGPSVDSLEREVALLGGRVECARDHVVVAEVDGDNVRLVAEMYRRGATIDQIAQFLDLTIERVTSWLARAGVHRRQGE